MCLVENNDDVSDEWLPALRRDLQISPFEDLTDAVERDGEHYYGDGEHSDLWRGKFEVDGVPTLDVVEVRGGSSRRQATGQQATAPINLIKSAGTSRWTAPEIMDPPNNDVTFNCGYQDDHPESSYWGQSQNVQTFSMTHRVSMRNSEIHNVGGNLTVNNYHVYLQPDSEPLSTWDFWTDWTQSFSDLKLKMFHAVERVENYLARFK